LKAALNHAWREGKTPSDDAWRRVRPFPEADAARVRYLTTDEARRLLHACDEDFRDIVEAALLTGARYGELAAMTVFGFNRDSGTVHSHEQGPETAPCRVEP
jgi:integrase